MCEIHAHSGYHRLAHFAIGVVGGKGGNNRTGQYFVKARCRGKNQRTDHQTGVHVIGKYIGPQGINEQAYGNQNGHGFHTFGNVEFM